MTQGLLQELGYFLLHAVGLRQGGDAGLTQDFVLGHVGGCRRIVGGLHRVLRRGHVFRLSIEYLADRIEGVDLRADVAILRRDRGNGCVETCEGGFCVALVGEICAAECRARAIGIADGGIPPEPPVSVWSVVAVELAPPTCPVVLSKISVSLDAVEELVPWFRPTLYAAFAV